MIRNCAIWGNHSSTQYPDCRKAEVEVNGEWKNIETVINDYDWTRKTLVASVQGRGAAVIAARKLSSAMSAASAIAAHLRDWCSGSDDVVSMGITSMLNPYKIREDLIFSFPLRCSGNWTYETVVDFEMDNASRELISKTTNELGQEKNDAFAILSASSSL